MSAAEVLVTGLLGSRVVERLRAAGREEAASTFFVQIQGVGQRADGVRVG